MSCAIHPRWCRKRRADVQGFLSTHPVIGRLISPVIIETKFCLKRLKTGRFSRMKKSKFLPAEIADEQKQGPLFFLIFVCFPSDAGAKASPPPAPPSQTQLGHILHPQIDDMEGSAGVRMELNISISIASRMIGLH